jgi:CheY-like chemotaxis protein
VILADIGLPDEDGYRFLESLRKDEEIGMIPVIAVTAYAGAENEARVLAAGFRMQCTKPLEPDEVAHAVLKVVGE